MYEVWSPISKVNQVSNNTLKIMILVDSLKENASHSSMYIPFMSVCTVKVVSRSPYLIS